MTNINNVAEIIRGNGIEAEVSLFRENGMEMHRITLGDGDIRPSVKIPFYDSMSDEEIADWAIDIFKHYKRPNMNSIKSVERMLRDWEAVKGSILPCLAREVPEHLVSRDFLDLKIYYRIVLSGALSTVGATITLTKQHLESFGVGEDEVFDIALENLKKKTFRKSLFKMLAEKIPEFESFASTEMADAPTMEILTTNNFGGSAYGASAILDKSSLKNFADTYESDVLIIPSSVHEVILTPIYNSGIMDGIDEMICAVNDEQVDEIDRLSSHKYIYKRELDEVVIG